MKRGTPDQNCGADDSGKPLPWLRLYLDILEEPKVQTLPDKLFKFWINCLCLTGKYLGSLPSPEDIAFSLRMKKPTVDEYLRKLFEADLLDSKDGTYMPHAWDKRQYKSDLSTDRVKRFRASKRNVSRNVSETLLKRTVKRPQITDTDTEADTPPLTPPLQGGECDLTDLARSIHARHPKHRRPVLQAVERALAVLCMDTPNPEATAAGIDDRHAGWVASADWTRDGQRFVPNLLKWLDPDHGGWMTEAPEAKEYLTETERNAAELLRELDAREKLQ